MSFLAEIKQKIGNDVFDVLDILVNKEVARAMQMDLVDQYNQKRWYRMNISVSSVIEQADVFEHAGLVVHPLDVVDVLFKCKVLFASSSEDEYSQRTGGVSLVDKSPCQCIWTDKSNGMDRLLEEKFNTLKQTIEDRTLLTEISGYHSFSKKGADTKNQQAFFDDLFASLGEPFMCFLSASTVKRAHKQHEPHLIKYTLREGRAYLVAPSIGYRCYGSLFYCYFKAVAYLRTLLNLIRISGFINAPQLDFGASSVFTAPTSPVFLGNHSTGTFCWDEDERMPHEKIPDGTLFLSFGYRGLSDMWLDSRSFAGMKNTVLQARSIFKKIANPWQSKCIDDIYPVLDLLSSATQLPDNGAKLLLIYCSLEHLFVPKDVQRENRSHVIGGIHALNPALIPWFNKLYEMRNAYAHKGFILGGKSYHHIITESLGNILLLLATKINTT